MKTSHAVSAKRRRKKIFELAKGFWGKRGNVYRRAREMTRRALAYAYRDRRAKKRTFRSLWIIRINAAVRERGLSYREFIHRLKQNNIILSRDILANIAADHPQAFDAIVNRVKNG